MVAHEARLDWSEAAFTTPPTRAEAVKAAALRLFAERGYLATTMDDIGRAAGIKGPSVYKHFESKQTLLHTIMRDTMQNLLTEHRLAIADCSSTTQRFRRAVECQARFHTRHRLEAFVGNREIRNLTAEHRAEVIAMRAAYEKSLRAIITQGVEEGVFTVRNPRLVSYAVLDMGMGISTWYRPDGPVSESEIVYQYGDFALSLVGIA